MSLQDIIMMNFTNPSKINPNKSIPNKPLRPNIVKAKVG